MLKKKSSIKVLFILFFCLQIHSNAFSENIHNLFFEANKAYEQENYKDAALKYNGIVQKGFATGDLYYNLGNCYLRMDETGRAILYYEKAKKLLPRDADLDFNLRYARDQISDKAEDKKDFSMLHWLRDFTLSELFWFFIYVNLFFWSSLIIRKWIYTEWSYYMMVACLIIWILSGASLSAKYYNIINDKRAVVVSSETIVRAGPDKKDTELFKLHSGTIVTCERTDSHWSLIQFTDNKRGWTEASNVIEITN